jgi:hypothetical protein
VITPPQPLKIYPLAKRSVLLVPAWSSLPVSVEPLLIIAAALMRSQPSGILREGITSGDWNQGSAPFTFGAFSSQAAFPLSFSAPPGVKSSNLRAINEIEIFV